MLNKSGQAGETMTWIVATLVIIFILFLAIFATNLLSKQNEFEYAKSSGLSDIYSRNSDLLMTKSLITYFSLDEGEDKEFLYSKLEEMDENKSFYGDFEKEFEELKTNLEEDEK